MQFNDNAQLDPSQMGGGGGGGGRIAVGGGIGTMILLFILSQVFGIDLSGLAGGGQQPEPSGNNSAFANCQTGADIKRDRNCRFVAYTNSIQSYWSQTLKGYQMTQTKIFTGQINTACGSATSAVGPFYCPADKFVYLDTGFFDELTQRFGAAGGDAAEAYVIAHEYGHHISNQIGTMDKVAQSKETGPTSASVRLELQADCFGGVWLKHAADDPNGPIQAITEDDLARAIDAAQAVGDDRIQQETQGRVDRESWTHGSSAMRKQWLGTGFSSGNPNSCDTFAANAKVA